MAMPLPVTHTLYMAWFLATSQDGSIMNFIKANNTFKIFFLFRHLEYLESCCLLDGLNRPSVASFIHF